MGPMLLSTVKFGEQLAVWDLLIRVFAAAVIGVLIGIDRETHHRPAGLRTHVLVCIGAAIIALIEQLTVADVIGLRSEQINVSMGRLTATVISGIGFIGAGTIMFSERRVIGLTTAASLWCTAGLGLAVGAGYLVLALICCIVILLVLKVLQKVLHVRSMITLQVRFTEKNTVPDALKKCFFEYDLLVIDLQFSQQTGENGDREYVYLYRLSVPKKCNLPTMIAELSTKPGIVAVSRKEI